MALKSADVIDMAQLFILICGMIGDILTLITCMNLASKGYTLLIKKLHILKTERIVTEFRTEVDWVLWVPLDPVH